MWSRFLSVNIAHTVQDVRAAFEHIWKSFGVNDNQFSLWENFNLSSEKKMLKLLQRVLFLQFNQGLFSQRKVFILFSQYNIWRYGSVLGSYPSMCIRGKPQGRQNPHLSALPHAYTVSLRSQAWQVKLILCIPNSQQKISHDTFHKEHSSWGILRKSKHQGDSGKNKALL